MQKIKSETFIFLLWGTGKERTSCKTFAWNTTRRCGDCTQNLQGQALLLVRFSPVDWLKNECGAWLKIRWVKGFLFASLSLSASGSPKEKEVRPKCRVVGVVTGGKNRSPGGSLPVPDFRR